MICGFLTCNPTEGMRQRQTSMWIMVCASLSIVCALVADCIAALDLAYRASSPSSIAMPKANLSLAPSQMAAPKSSVSGTVSKGGNLSLTRTAREDASLSPVQNTTSAGGSQHHIPWETPGASSSSAPNAPVNWTQPPPSVGQKKSDGSIDGNEADLTDSALDAFLANLGDIESGQSWAWPLFGDALELDLGPSSDNMSSSAPNSLPTPAQHSDSSAGNSNFLPNKMVTAAAVLEHLPALYDVR